MLHVHDGQCGLCVHFGETHVPTPQIIEIRSTMEAPEALLDFCQPRMPYFAVPRYLRVLDDLPRTENGKVRKFRLRDDGITADTWDRDAAGYRVTR